MPYQILTYCLVVDRVGAYSHTPDMATDLHKVRMNASERRPSGSTERRTGPWSLADRGMDPATVDRMVGEYLAGVTAAGLSAAYGVGLTSVKRMLRERGARRRAT